MSHSGVYSNLEILEAIEAGKIVFHPMSREQINGASVNVSLGKWYYRVENNRSSNFYNPFSKNDIKKYFSGPFEAIEHQTWVKESGHRLFQNIPADHPIIVLKPGERILAHTHEFIGIKPPGTSTMKSRSTWGRNGIAACFDAGWGDPGYINRWTMEVYNLNQNHSVALPVGECLAQIIFIHTGPVKGRYDSLSGKYQQSDNLEELIKQWKPVSMLPKAYKDKRKLPKEL